MTEGAVAGPVAQSARTRPAGSRAFDIAVALLIGLFCFAVYNANLRAIPAADSYAARYLPFSILRNHTVVLDPIVDTVAQGRLAPPARGQNSSAFWITHGLGSHQVSTYPVLLPVVIAPLYLPAVAYLDARGWDPHLFDRVARIMEKLVASLIAAASVALLYLLLRRRSTPRTAALLSLVYAFATTTWVVSSQALWAHGLAQLLIVATMLLLTGPRTALRAAAAGFLCAMIAANRPADAILAAALGLYGLWWAGPLRLGFIATGMVPVGLTAAYNLLVVGHVAGAYALFVRPHNYNDDVLGGIVGLLFSPTRGLFVFSPFLLFLLCLFPLALRDKAQRSLTLAIWSALVLQVVFYAMVDWRQGVSWGPRWLGDALPMLMWMLPPVVAALSRPGRILFGAACAVAIAIQAVGAFWYLGTVDAVLVQASGHDRMVGMWRPQNAPFIAELRHPPASGDLLRAVRGNVDLVQVIDVLLSGGEQDDRIERQVDVAGWALVDSRSPLDIALLVDGRFVTGTGEFFTRPDVVQTLGETSPAGWRLRFPVGQLAAGTHSLAVLVRTDPGAEPRLLRLRSFEVPEPGPTRGHDPVLARSARLAVQRLAQHQQPPGYWLTSFTSGPRYDKPQREMNTYLNAVMLDVAAPAAADVPLEGLLAKARAFLTSQIEADGLVRYHGRPDAPTIGVLGCAITPDSDDTSLVWRVAPHPDRTLLPRALKHIHRFQRPDGLYRTWLAERDRYQCLDPGHDPNPADLVIQMHILMLLAQEEPPAAAALCRALAARSNDDDVWVYYAGAPPMVLLRLADLEHAGCALEVPPSRLRSDVPGQARWVAVAQSLREMQRGPATEAQYAAASSLLRELAASDFALVARTPPLLYHNDLSATVRRFYWSEDLGYALWLRLYHEQQRLGLALQCRAHDAAAGCGS
ncbi:hypothetical protein WDL1CHR_05465 [Variovorax sp. WDL1]|nr:MULTISPECIES: hypothetical protein [unclassified Variovorax]PNG47142.1 hypothetical protein CHC06_07490 [Variovorax sp. B2]PNG48207.1 hypothetical protein CHC07_07378 [Variovorax sp. B4]VTV15012.1 hypothetical protein WDL1CHR_05465 [Variovorax sp. WDL1]